MICEFCGKEHDGSYGTGRFCNKSCRAKWAGQRTKEAFKKNFTYVPKLETRICPKCGKQFTVDIKRDYYKKFCSRSCANSHKVTEETKEKIRQSVNRYLSQNGQKGSKSIQVRILTCEVCGKQFEHYSTNKRHTCYNPKCIHQYLSNRVKQNPNTGGCRPNSGNGKSGWYKGISCQSTYELAWVIYNLDHNIKFQKCKKVFEYEIDEQKHKYHPDFELEDGTIIEIKGYYQHTVKLKEQAVLEEGYKYKIFYEQDLKECFDYVKEKYNVNKENLVKLYDVSKGYIEKTCVICGRKFLTRNEKQETCSKSCNGKNTANRVWIKKNSQLKHIKRYDLKQYLDDNWKQVKWLRGKPCSLWKEIS